MTKYWQERVAIPGQNPGIRAVRFFESSHATATASTQPQFDEPQAGRWLKAIQTGSGHGLVRIRRRKMR